jgi:hypothetical protein
MISALMLLLLSSQQPANQILLREALTPSRMTTRFEAECGRHLISARWTAAYPGRHRVEEVVVDGRRSTDEELGALNQVVGSKQIEQIGVSRCGRPADNYDARLYVQFGTASARRSASPRIVEVEFRGGQMTILQR